MSANPNKIYRYSYSGADAKVFAYYDGMEDDIAHLESMHTISISVHEAKGQARALGYRGIRGVARGVRTIAGSMILTVIEDHPLRELVSKVGPYMARESAVWGGWSLDRHTNGTGRALDNYDFNNRLSTLLPPFNILIQYASEGSKFNEKWNDINDIRYDTIEVLSKQEQRQRVKSLGEDRVAQIDQINRDLGIGPPVSKSQTNRYEFPGAAMLIDGIEIINSGIVTSTNDVVSEVTISFIARDFKPLAPMTLGTRPKQPSLDQDMKESFFRSLFGNRAAGQINRQVNRDKRNDPDFIDLVGGAGSDYTDAYVDGSPDKSRWIEFD